MGLMDNIKDQIIKIQEDFKISYKEARFLLKQHLRQKFEDKEIDKKTWKMAKKILSEVLR